MPPSSATVRTRAAGSSSVTTRKAQVSIVATHGPLTNKYSSTGGKFPREFGNIPGFPASLWEYLKRELSFFRRLVNID